MSSDITTIIHCFICIKTGAPDPDPHRVPNEKFLDLVTLSRLGLEPDYKIAKEVGVSKFVIAKHRKKLGIPSYAVSTGNNGKIKIGDPHRRWNRA